MERNTQPPNKEAAKLLIDEYLNGKHTLKQLESLLKAEGIKLIGRDTGKGKLKYIIANLQGNYREALIF